MNIQRYYFTLCTQRKHAYVEKLDAEFRKFYSLILRILNKAVSHNIYLFCWKNLGNISIYHSDISVSYMYFFINPKIKTGLTLYFQFIILERQDYFSTLCFPGGWKLPTEELGIEFTFVSVCVWPCVCICVWMCVCLMKVNCT